MTLNEYQAQAMNTCMPSCENFSYMMLNLVGEVGELASKVAKAIRKDKFFIGSDITGKKYIGSTLCSSLDTPSKEVQDLYTELKKEAGDVLWQLSGLCTVMRWSLEDVAQTNLDKLASRKERGVIDGDGDNR